MSSSRPLARRLAPLVAALMATGVLAAPAFAWSDPISAPTGGPDPMFSQQWGLAKIRAPQAWLEPKATGAGIKIAIVDSGLDLQFNNLGVHEDFTCLGKLSIVPGSDVGDGDSDPNDQTDGHGTHVAGIAGACTNNGRGISGVAPSATLMPIKVFGRNDIDFDRVMADGISLAVANGAHVINLSIGPDPLSGSYSSADLFPRTEAALRAASDLGVVVAAAAGNNSLPLCEFPSLSRFVICVGATDRNDVRAWYSDLPNNVDQDGALGFGPSVMAPGGQDTLCGQGIISTYLRREIGICTGASGYDELDGTSMSAPHVAGVAALVYGRLDGVRNAANRQLVVDAIIDNAVDLGSPGYDPVYGYGRVDALGAVRAIPTI